ncbi:sensor histidine kinase [Sphingomonas jaspsi]|uniref:sensor histidine kinase n=1 Tax=Sphingomonas jaspsi TaxID=392409 RepID=UPI0004AF828D|nr:sensor histidine kinase [Sphingomonas jaspsi]
MNRLGNWFGGLTTPLKILLIISLALLPIGGVGAWMTKRNFDAANRTIADASIDQARDGADAIERLIGRNVLSMKVAGAAALAGNGPAPCDDVRRYLALAPAFGSEFSVEDATGNRICAVGDAGAAQVEPLAAPGDIRIWLDPAGNGLYVRAGLVGGSATIHLSSDELVHALTDGRPDIRLAALQSGDQMLTLVDLPSTGKRVDASFPIASRRLTAKVAVDRPLISPIDRLVIFLPILMWAAAAIVSWWMIQRMIIRPLRDLQRSVSAYDPAQGGEIVLPATVGPTAEISELGTAFQRAVDRIEGAEREARDALEGQRRLVREVHHRVKNNLQVVASLLSIHGRTAVDPEAKAAYAAIGRRVDALSVVHRNHYAELEENRGIALRPLLTELSAGLRASAPVEARAMPFELEVDNASTTQDVAVAAAFLVTEIVEFAMLREPHSPVRIAVRRAGDLTATLAIESAVLRPDTDDDDDQSRVQFERVVEGLSRQLRSPLDRRLGRYAVTLPIFPDR